jgi:hypothetical protein
MQFTEVTTSSAWDFEKNPVVEGQYIKKDTDVGENGSNMYKIQQEDGSVVSVWGSTVLDNKMDNVGIGQYIQIKYLGKKPSPNRKGKEYKDFSVFIGNEPAL